MHTTLVRRTLYLGYYLRSMEAGVLRRFAGYAAREQGTSRAALYADVLRCVYEHNVSPMDYFQFRFFDQTAAERAEWAGTGFMYEYQRVMNPPGARAVLADKVRFLDRFRPFFRRPFATRDALRDDRRLAEPLLDGPSGRVVLKLAAGQCGREVAVLETAGLNGAGLLRAMDRGGYDLAEGYVAQHPDLMDLSPSGLNTLRVVTQLTPSGDVELLGVRLRITVNQPVDNMAAGNLAAPVDAASGKVDGPGVYGDITKADAERHPVTGRPIAGFQVPLWSEARRLAEQAAQLAPENRSVGWDIGITPDGPELIEGNHNWCKLLWQLPVKRGLKHLLHPYL